MAVVMMGMRIRWVVVVGVGGVDSSGVVEEVVDVGGMGFLVFGSQDHSTHQN